MKRATFLDRTTTTFASRPVVVLSDPQVEFAVVEWMSSAQLRSRFAEKSVGASRRQERFAWCEPG